MKAGSWHKTDMATRIEFDKENDWEGVTDVRSIVTALLSGKAMCRSPYVVKVALASGAGVEELRAQHIKITAEAAQGLR